MTNDRNARARSQPHRTIRRLPLAAVVALGAVGAAQGQEAEFDLAKALANPISSLISVPVQFNYDGGIGSADGTRFSAVLQPVVPFDINDELSIVARTILPITWQNDTAGASGTQFGLADTVQSLFLVPASVDTPLGELSYGVGPVAALPTSTDRLLGSGTFGLGPTGVFLFQNGGWTYGALVNHVWGVADTRNGVPELNSTYMQPFFAYTTADDWTIALNTETSYDWAANDWGVPVNLMAAKLVQIGDQYVQFQGGVRYWADSPNGGPDGVGARFTVTFLFPK